MHMIHFKQIGFVTWCLAASAAAQQTGFHLVGFVPGAPDGSVWDMTPDGSKAVGWHSANFLSVGFEWSLRDGRLDYTGESFPNRSDIRGVSDDGQATCGAIQVSPDLPFHAFVRTSSDGFRDIRLDLGERLWCRDMDGIGRLLVGQLYQQRGEITDSWPVLWTAETDLVIAEVVLPYLEQFSSINGVDSSGQVLVGHSSGEFGYIPCRWTRDGRVHILEEFLAPGGIGDSAVRGVSHNGRYIVGDQYRGGYYAAVRWATETGQFAVAGSRGTPPGANNCGGWVVSDDGVIVAGECYGGLSTGPRGIVWNEGEGDMVWARQYFSEHGAPIPEGWDVWTINAISADGLAMGGSAVRLADGFTNGFVAYLSAVRCPADFNGDGGVDGSDVEAFFIAWESSESGADVNGDGGVDGGDVETFFVNWEAGGC